MRFDIFCDIVDNYGDAGVCWRLARRLAQTSPIHNQDSIRLFCNDLNLLNLLAGGDALEIGKQLNIQILPWEDACTESFRPDIIIEAFGCELPSYYLSQINQFPDSIIINLDYLSAEEWIDSHHGLPSHSNGIKKYFFFPGFSAKTGGVLKGNLPNKTSPPPLSLKQPWELLIPNSMKISLFCYETPEVIEFLEQLSQQNLPINLLVCYGQAQTTISKWIKNDLILGKPSAFKNLNIIPIPFVSQDDFDWMLSQCDLNIVRGEDSFVRAQWAGKPFIWQIYPQSDNAHNIKLDAFLNKYLVNTDLGVETLAKSLMQWKITQLSADSLVKLTQHAVAWKSHLLKLTENGDLAEKLREFIKINSKIK